MDVAVKRFLEFKNNDASNVYVIREGVKMMYEDVLNEINTSDNQYAKRLQFASKSLIIEKRKIVSSDI